jgi:hypothetical protein
MRLDKAWHHRWIVSKTIPAVLVVILAKIGFVVEGYKINIQESRGEKSVCALQNQLYSRTPWCFHDRHYDKIN